MRCFHGVLASFLFAVLLVACNTVDPSECWPNTSGGFGGGGTIPIGAGVGATSSGDFITPPPHDPLDHGGVPDNPCVTHESGEAPGMGSVFSYFRPSNFAFVTVVVDDGQGPAGGWQETTTVLALADGLTTIYSCKVHIGMPTRTQSLGTIFPASAAARSATVANLAAGLLWPTSYPQGIFCSTFVTEMGTQFENRYPTLGARMMP